MSKKIVNTVDVDGNSLELCVLKPTAKQLVDADIVYSREWLHAENNGCPIRRNLDSIARKHGLWDDAKEKKVGELEKEILDIEKKLRSGSTFYKTVALGREAALQLKKLRRERLSLLSARTSLDEHTAESHAETAKTNYLLSVCVLYNNNGNKFFRDVNDLLERSLEKATVDVTKAYMELIYADILDYEKNMFENQFLKMYGFVDDKFRLINKDKHLIDEAGRLLDEQGRYINANGEYVDADGNKVDENGDYIVEFKPFVDEDGNEIKPVD